MQHRLRLALLLWPVVACLVSAERLLESGSLNLYQQGSGFSASLFNFVYTPSNGSLTVKIKATSSIQGMVKFDFGIVTYGYQAVRLTINPCNIDDLRGLCPMSVGNIDFTYIFPIGEKAAGQIPGIAYSIPDLDATARVYINLTSSTGPGESVACVEANVSNGKTVNLVALKWATAIIAGLAMLASAVISGLGYSHAAAHIAANSLSLIGYMQAQAILGLSSVRLPPVAQAWTMNFQWSLGIIRVAAVQTALTWFQRATGGTPSDVLDSLHTTSVQVAKRSLGGSIRSLVKRAESSSSGAYLVYGIDILLIMVIVSTTMTFFRKNPDAVYHHVADDRASFVKSHTHLHNLTELDELAATARGCGR